MTFPRSYGGRSIVRVANSVIDAKVQMKVGRQLYAPFGLTTTGEWVDLRTNLYVEEVEA
jgi:predicted NodU family carbamoyl transferase